MDLTSYYLKTVNKDPNYDIALTTVRNVVGDSRIWVIGSTVYRSVIKGLYQNIKDERIHDFDVIVKKIPDSIKLKVPDGWTYSESGLGNPSLSKEEISIDIVPIRNAVINIIPAKTKTIATWSQIEGYQKDVPFNVQSILYDIQNNKIIGEVGINAIKSKCIKVLNIDDALGMCKRRRISLYKSIKVKASSLKFEPVIFKFNTDPIKVRTTSYFNLTTTEQINNWNLKIENLKEHIDKFLRSSPGKKILDVGSGTGEDSLYFKKLGYNPLCVDISENMVRVCRQKGLEAVCEDIETLPFDEDSFDGVWANNTLTHIPKYRIYNTLARLREILNKQGILFVTVPEGRSEVINGLYNVAYSEVEFKENFEQYFDIIESGKIKLSGNIPYLYFLGKPNNFVYKRN